MPLTGNDVIAEMLKYGFEKTYHIAGGKNLKSEYFSFHGHGRDFKIRLSDHPPTLWRMIDEDLHNDLYLDRSDSKSKVKPFYFDKKTKTYSKHPREIELSETDVYQLTGKAKPTKIFYSKSKGDKYVVHNTRKSKSGKNVYFCSVYQAQPKKVYYKKIAP